MYIQFEKRRQFLRITDLMSFDRGNYTCVVSNRHGQLQHTFIVDVVGKCMETVCRKYAVTITTMYTFIVDVFSECLYKPTFHSKHHQ